MDSKQIVIAGGGIAGLAAALGVARSGSAALILEKSADFREVGAAVQVGPNAVRALQSLGAWEAVEPATSQPEAIHIRDARSGALLQQVDLGADFRQRFGAPYRVILRADLQAALLTVARANPRIEIRTNVNVSSIISGHETATVTTQAGNFEPSLVIAADGIHSPLRQAMWPGTAARATGHTLYRALLPQAPAGASHPECVTLWMGSGFHVVHYAAGPKATFNLVVSVEGERDPMALLGESCKAVTDCLNAVPNWLPWPALNVEGISTWVKGNTVLLGDSAHGTVPYFAQGAAMALEDAARLNELLASGVGAVLEPANWAKRYERACAVQAASLRNGRIYHMSGLAAVARNLGLRLMPQGVFLKQLEWLYGGSGRFDG